MKMNATLVLAAVVAVGSSIASLLVPVMMAKQAEQITMVYSSSGRRPITSVMRAPRMAPRKQRTGLIPFKASTLCWSVMPADWSMAAM